MHSHLNNTTAHDAEVLGSEKVGTSMSTIALMLSLLIVATNLSIVILLIRSRRLRNKIHIVLVLSLSFTDLMVGISGFIFAVTYYVPSLSNSIVMCYLFTYVFTTGVAASLVQTFLICLNRFLKVSRSQWNKTFFAGNRKYTVTATAWVLVHTHLLWGISLIPDKVVYCSIKTLFAKNERAYLTSLSFIYIIFFVSTMILYLLTIYKIKQHFKSVDASESIDLPVVSGNSIIEHGLTVTCTSGIHRNVLNVTMNVGIIVVFLLAFNGPYIIVVILEAVTLNINRKWRLFCCFAAQFNSAANPVIYTWRFIEVRQELKKIIFCKR